LKNAFELPPEDASRREMTLEPPLTGKGRRKFRDRQRNDGFKPFPSAKTRFYPSSESQENQLKNVVSWHLKAQVYHFLLENPRKSANCGKCNTFPITLSRPAAEMCLPLRFGHAGCGVVIKEYFPSRLLNTSASGNGFSMAAREFFNQIEFEQASRLFAKLGRRGGQSRSPAKISAARENARKARATRVNLSKVMALS
jgi:hypothetical protein